MSERPLVPPGFVELTPRPRCRLLVVEPLAEQWSAGLPDEGEGESLRLGGRGGLRRVATELGPALVRRTRRGGLLRGVLPDRFFSATRARCELEAGVRLHERSLAPRPLALEVTGWPLHGIRLAFLEVPGAIDLLRLSRERPERWSEPGLGRLVGRTVAAMHDAGVAHPDLNLSNLLLEEEASERVLVCDLDGAGVGERPVSTSEREDELLRLCRSVDKRASSRTLSAWGRRAVLQETLPAERRRSFWTRARTAHQQHRRLGRVED
ncbi:MAG: lipopolysaccharide kinase InaA family protein [Acidobacteriota bacterium]